MPNALSLLARLCLLWLVPVALLTARADDFLPAKSAYKVTTAVDAGRLVVRYEIAPGYYLYRDRLGFEVVTPGVTLAAPTLPVGIDHEDEYFGRQVIYRDVAVVGVPVTFAGAPRDFDLKLKLQGCADAGLCYPPQNWPVSIAWPQGTAQASQQGMDAAAVADTAAPNPQPRTQVPPAVNTAAVDGAGDTPPPKQSGGFNLRKLLGSGAKSDADFLPADRAFVFSATSPARDRVRLRWDVADDYYLYRDKVKVTTSAPGVQLGVPAIPGGEVRHDEYFGEQVVFYGEMIADLSLVAAAGTREVPIEVELPGLRRRRPLLSRRSGRPRS